MSTAPSLVVFRDDLRVRDHAALTDAFERGGPVIGVYVLDDESPGIRPLGGAARWWLHGSLDALTVDLAALGVPLVLRRGPAGRVVRELIDETDAATVLWSRRYGGPERAVDTELKSSLRDAGVDAQSFAGSLLFEPWTIRTGQGTPYSVFTPYWRACRQMPEPRAPLPAPEPLSHAVRAASATTPDGDDLASWNLRPTSPDWAGGLRDAWTPGAASAHERLAEFIDDDLVDYAAARDRFDREATSRLSPHLRWGEISPFEVWAGARDAGARGAASAAGAAKFQAEIGWREFAWHVLFHSPNLATRNWRPEFDEFPWPHLHPALLHAWQHGRTGVPVVDAGMRELWATGTMHNRVRMVVASFLTKNLLIDWRRGEEWFWDTLVDADAAANPFNWQWVAGSGADAAPYFRVFNPELQRSKFDPDDRYVRRWLPGFDPDDELDPIVDLRESRRAALEAYDVVKTAAARA